MAEDTLRVRARGEALVQDYEALEAGIKRFVGRKYVQVEGGQWGFAPTNAEQVVPNHAEYLREIREGALWAADEATAAKAGVKFDATFGAVKAAKKDAST